jgi:hypothetical protein
MELSRGTALAARFITLRKRWIVGTKSAEQIDAPAAKRKRGNKHKWGCSHFSFAKAASPPLCLFFNSLIDSV